MSEMDRGTWIELVIAFWWTVFTSLLLKFSSIYLLLYVFLIFVTIVD